MDLLMYEGPVDNKDIDDMNNTALFIRHLLRKMIKDKIIEVGKIWL